VAKEDGTVEPAKGISWKQHDPRLGDIVFMRGGNTRCLSRPAGGAENRKEDANTSNKGPAAEDTGAKKVAG
jgi:hypothetical protein